MTMINPNFMRTVGEVLQSHGIRPREGERLADTAARALGLSDIEAERWIEALNNGCTPEEANRRAGIANHRASEPLLVALARVIGKGIGNLSTPLKDQGDKLDQLPDRSSAKQPKKKATTERQDEPLKDQGDKLDHTAGAGEAD